MTRLMQDDVFLPFLVGLQDIVVSLVGMKEENHGSRNLLFIARLCL